MSSPEFRTLGDVQSYEREARGLLIDCGGPRVSIRVLTPDLLRVRLAPLGAFAARRPWDPARDDDEFAAAPFEVEEHDERILLKTEALSVELKRRPLRIAFFDAQGRRFCADGTGLQWRDAAPDPASASVACVKQIEAGEHFYGFGERTGHLDKLGRGMTGWTIDPAQGHGPGSDPLYIDIPLFMALRPGLAYGVMLHNTWRSHFDMGCDRPVLWQMQAAGGEMDYYVAYGPEPAAVMQQWVTLLGSMPLPPRWALGFQQSRWSYMSADIVRDLVAQFRARGLPCDAIHFDIDYMRGYRVFTWDPQRFPDPPALLKELHDNGYHCVAIIDPGVKADPEYFVYREGLAQDRFIRKANGEVFHGFVWPDDSVFPDFTRPDVREWWGALQAGFVAAGLDGVWNDMNEPTSFNRPFSTGSSHPQTLDLDAVQGPPEARTVHAEVHNVYGSCMARASYEGLVAALNGERPFVLTRSAYAGIQRWSACWMGDNTSWWEHLEMAMPQLMNMGLSGVPFVGTDIGGFGGNASGELFARWMQLGALSPFCRAHSAMGSEQHEPWAFGPRVESISHEFLRLRYRLLPYIYSLFREAAESGAPVLRPLLYHHPNDTATYSLHDEFMLGPFLLAAPIYQPGRDHRYVYLPAGRWYDWWTGAAVDGPAHMLVHAPLEVLPLYVRAGAVLPCGPDLQYTGEKPLDPLSLDVFPGDGEFTLYEDDGHSYEYSRGGFCTTHYQVGDDQGRLSLHIGARQGEYVPAARRLIVRLHAVDDSAAHGHPGAEYDAAQRVLALPFDDDGSARDVSVETA